MIIILICVIRHGTLASYTKFEWCRSNVNWNKMYWLLLQICQTHELVRSSQVHENGRKSRSENCHKTVETCSYCIRHHSYLFPARKKLFGFEWMFTSSFSGHLILSFDDSDDIVPLLYSLFKVSHMLSQGVKPLFQSITAHTSYHIHQSNHISSILVINSA